MFFRALRSYFLLIKMLFSIFIKSIKNKKQPFRHKKPVITNRFVPPGTTSDVFRGFVSSKCNPDGMHVDFYQTEDDEIYCEWVADAKFEGYPKALHGGIAISILDELSAYSMFDRYQTYAVSLSCHVRWLGKIHIGSSIYGKAKVSRRLGRLAQVDSTIMNKHGRELVKMTSVFLIPTRNQFKQFVGLSIMPDEALPYCGQDKINH